MTIVDRFAFCRQGRLVSCDSVGGCTLLLNGVNLLLDSRGALVVPL
jgi:hypothetical protein